jgi:hypothetical protein
MPVEQKFQLGKNAKPAKYQSDEGVSPARQGCQRTDSPPIGNVPVRQKCRTGKNA